LETTFCKNFFFENSSWRMKPMLGSRNCYDLGPSQQWLSGVRPLHDTSTV
jgi:hypothetical protein